MPLHLTTLRADIRVNGTLEDDILSEESDEGLIIWDCESFRPIRVALDMYVRGKDVAVVINENYLVGNVESSRDVDELLNYMKLPSCRDTYEILKYYYYYKITKGVHRNIIRIARQMIRRWLNKDNVTRQLIIGDQSISRRTREE